MTCLKLLISDKHLHLLLHQLILGKVATTSFIIKVKVIVVVIKLVALSLVVLGLTVVLP